MVLNSYKGMAPKHTNKTKQSLQKPHQRTPKHYVNFCRDDHIFFPDHLWFFTAQSAHVIQKPFIQK